MKILLLLASLLSISCQNSTPTESPATQTGSNLPAASPAPAAKAVLVGKRVPEIKQMGYYNCEGMGLGDVAGGGMWYTVKWAPKMGACFSERNIITLERILTGDGSFTEDRVVEAELPVYPKEGENTYTIVPLSLAGKPKEFYVAAYTGTSYKTITGIQKLWRINLEGKTFEETPVPAGFSFENPYQLEGQ